MSGIAGAIWNEFLPAALAQGRMIPKPDPVVVGNGLEEIQQGLNKAKEGYSAKKLVVRL